MVMPPEWFVAMAAIRPSWVPFGYTFESYTSPSDSSYRITVIIDRASELYGHSIECGEDMGVRIAKQCPVAE